VSEPLTPAPATSEDEPSHLQTKLPDLSDVPLSALRDLQFLDGELESILQQIAKPRFNLGGAGPPGRAD